MADGDSRAALFRTGAWCCRLACAGNSPVRLSRSARMNTGSHPPEKKRAITSWEEMAQAVRDLEGYAIRNLAYC